MSRCRERNGWIVAALLATVALLAPAAALAHVDVRPGRVGPGYTLLQFFLYHGCGSAPTERFTIKLPDGVGLAQPHVKAGWTISTVTSEYAEPLDVYGEVHTSGFTEVTWAGGSIPSAYIDNFVLAVYVRDRPGHALQFAVEQWCTGVAEPETETPEVLVLGPEPAAAPPPPATEGDAAAADSPDDGPGTFPLYLSYAALGLALVALLVALRRRN